MSGSLQIGRDEGVIVQAGAVPLRWTSAGVEVLLVTNRAGEWIVPKGMIDANRTAEQTAVTECLEEAGVMGVLVGPELGTYQYQKASGLYRVRVFALEVQRELPRWLEQHQRQRRWMRPAHAAAKVGLEGLAEIVLRVGELRRLSGAA